MPLLHHYKLLPRALTHAAPPSLTPPRIYMQTKWNLYLPEGVTDKLIALRQRYKPPCPVPTRQSSEQPFYSTAPFAIPINQEHARYTKAFWWNPVFLHLEQATGLPQSQLLGKVIEYG